MPEFDSTIQYKEIAGQPLYRAGSDGSVWSCNGRRGPPRPWFQLRPNTYDKCNHQSVTLAGRNWRPIHQLILEAFVGPCPEGLECRHLDGDATNNRLSNLCWGTRLENVADVARHGRLRYGERHGSAKITEDSVRRIRSMAAAGEVRRVIAEKFGVHESCVNSVVHRRTWKHVV